jgi:hypothetical protein
MMAPPLWLAPRDNQDWIDEEILLCLDFFEEHVPAAAWQSRLDAARRRLHAARAKWATGDRVPVFDPRDAIAFYAFQARAHAAARKDWYEPEAYRIVSVFRRLGELVPALRTVDGIGDRILRLLTDGRRQPDDGLYELLVAGAYAVRGWDVAFVPEQPGVQKRPDLFVSRGQSRWAAECKRVGRGEYALGETTEGRRIAGPVHQLATEKGRSVIVQLSYLKEPNAVPDDYLLQLVERLAWRGEPIEWHDATSRGKAWNLDWRPIVTVLREDDIYFGSSRMIELVSGHYVPYADHDMDGRWTPSRTHPFHAADVHQLSLVSWTSESREAARRKARHFRSIVGRANEQMPGDRAGVVHIGYETGGASPADTLRHMLNLLEVSDFNPGPSRLRWVYANYMSPERPAAADESAALSESTACYKVGKHRTRQPLPGHMLFGNEGGKPGWHL